MIVRLMEHQRIRGTTPELDLAARLLRSNLTEAEAQLWQALRRKQLGVRFRRQHPIERFVVDFCCPACKLIVEVDGEVHLAQAEADAARTERLECLGYRVLRFSNQAVLGQLDWVLAEIRQAMLQ